MADSWNSIDAMQRLSRGALTTALVCAAVAVAAWPFTWIVAVPAVVLAFCAVLGSAFAWFRLDDLRGRERR